jgi:hypothetical protein
MQGIYDATGNVYARESTPCPNGACGIGNIRMPQQMSFHIVPVLIEKCRPNKIPVLQGRLEMPGPSGFPERTWLAWDRRG